MRTVPKPTATPTVLVTYMASAPATIDAALIDAEHDTATVQPAGPLRPVAATAAPLVLIPTATPAAIALQSPLPTPIPVLPSPPITSSMALTDVPVTNVPVTNVPVTNVPVTNVQESVTLSDTVAIQQQITISMALVARSLMQILQEPVYVSPILTDTVLGIPAVADRNASAPPLTAILSNTIAPPLPVGQIGGVTLPPVTPPAPPEFSNGPQPQIQPDGELRTARVPILMYHYLSTPAADADIYRRDLSVTPERFTEHLDRISRDGYTVIRLYDLIAHLTQGTPLPPNPVVITFDDGYRDNYENAFPLLRERNMSATFFVVMEFINQARPEYLTWEMVSEMAAGGMDIEVHGVDHTTLRGRSQVDLEFQALRSYETLQNLLNVRPRFISYPAGEYDQQTIAIFQSAGYWAGLTTIQGATHRSDRLFELNRVRIRGTTTAEELADLLALDW